MDKYVYNADSISHNWLGQTIATHVYFQIPLLEQAKWSENSTFIDAIIADTAIMSKSDDSSGHITDHNEAINFLKNIDTTLSKHNVDNVLLVEQTLPVGEEGSEGVTIVTHDWSDRRTWYQNALLIDEETLTDSGNGLLFNSSKTNWVWIVGSNGGEGVNPKAVFDSKGLLQRDGSFDPASDYKVVVIVNDVEKTSGFTVNYANGTITFDSSQTGNTVKATFWHNKDVSNRSEFIVSPLLDTTLVLKYVELQFSKNISFSSKFFTMEAWGGGVLADYEGIAWSRAYPYCQEWNDFN